jgi:hypothetical protein
MPQSIKDILSAPLPLSLVMFLMVQTMAAVWWASTQVSELHIGIAGIKMQIAQIKETENTNVSQERRIIVLEQTAEHIIDELGDIKSTLRSTNGYDNAR